MKKIAALVFCLTLAFAVLTLIALEGYEVAVLHTALDTDQPRQTRVWVVDFGGSPWIEAASPEREFFHDILADPNVALTRGGERFEYRAAPLPGDTGHDLIRSLLRDKYGWADRWVGMLADTSDSIAIRLQPR